MVRTIVSILVSFALLLGISAYEIYSVGTTFKTFSEALVSLYNKAEDQTATYEDGVAVRTYWKDKKRTLHVWIPHTSIENVYLTQEEVPFPKGQAAQPGKGPGSFPAG